MGKPLMIQEDDEEKIESLKARLGVKTKIDVVRAGLRLLEQEADRVARIERWRRATRVAATSSASTNKDFRRHSRLKRL